MRLAAIVMLATACGRFDFGARPSSSDGAVVVAGSDATPPPGDGSGSSGCAFLLCDGFEAASLDPVWTPSASGVSLDATVARAGRQSLHVHTNALAVTDSAEAIVTETATFATPLAMFYVRAFVRTGALPANNLGVIEADQATAAPDGDGVFITSTGFTLFSQFSEQSMDSMYEPMVDAWTCAVWQVALATGSTGSEQLGGDIPATAMTGVITDGSPAIAQLELGIEFATSTDTSPQPAFDLWIDDVIVSATPVTCFAGD